jgi:hypothetical protein
MENMQFKFLYFSPLYYKTNVYLMQIILQLLKNMQIQQVLNPSNSHLYKINDYQK